jgi:hypothetical protein
MLYLAGRLRSGIIVAAVMIAVLVLVVGAPAAHASPLASPPMQKSQHALDGVPQEGPYPPVQCFPMDMEGPGGIVYDYKNSVREPIGNTHRDVHHYDYSFRYGERAGGSTWCFGRPELVAGDLSPDGQTCLYAGVAAVVGAAIPQVGVVNAVFFFSTTCGIALLVD